MLVTFGSNPHVLHLVQPRLGFTFEEWDQAIQEELDKERGLDQMEEKWKLNQLSNKEREMIFESSSVSAGQSLLMKQRYILEVYEELACKQNKNEADLKKMRDLKNEYRYRFETRGISPEDIAEAKSYPLSNLLVVRRGFAKCPFHAEKTPSFHVYKNNTYYCFGCHQWGDPIDLVKHLHKVDFKTAVKYLIENVTPNNI